MPTLRSFFPAVAAAAIAVSALITGCTTTSDSTHHYNPSKTYRFTILHTNDHHGHFWKNSKGEWGMAARKTLIDGIREEVEEQGGHVLLLSGGDINTGVPESDLQKAVPDFHGMNLLGYDAMAVGNHEFDNPLETIRMQQDIANFPFLSANIFEEDTGKPLFDAYKLFDFDGVSVAVMGLTTEDTVKIGNPDNVRNIDFRSPVETAKKLVPELKEQADIVIATTHMGHYANALHGVNAPGDVTLAREVNGIDLIVGGHSQNPLFKPDQQNGTWIVQAQDWGRYVGRADFEFKNSQLTLVNYKLIPVNHKNQAERFAENKEMLALLTPYQEKGAKLVSQKVGNVDARLVGDRSEVRFGYTNLGTLMATAQQNRVKADFGVINSGGIRDSISAGDITYKDVLTVQPFGNTVGYIDLTGKEVKEYLEVVATMPTNSGAFAHFSGIKMTVKGKEVSDIMIDGKPLDEAKTYRMAVNSFSAAGGDGYPNLKATGNFIDSGLADAEVLKEYIKQHSPLKVADYEPAGITRL